jgi:hypothetical protein
MAAAGLKTTPRQAGEGHEAGQSQRKEFTTMRAVELATTCLDPHGPNDLLDFSGILDQQLSRAIHDVSGRVPVEVNDHALPVTWEL